MVKTAQAQQERETDRVMLKTHNALDTLKMLQIVRRYNLEDNELILINGSGMEGCSKGGYCSIVIDRARANTLYEECQNNNIEHYLLIFTDDPTNYTMPKYGMDEFTTLQMLRQAEKELTERELNVRINEMFWNTYLDMIG